MEEILNAQVVEEVKAEERAERQRFSDALRECAAWFESHPEVKLPESSITIYLFSQIADIAPYARAFGKCKKSGDENFFNLTKWFGSTVELQACWHRQQVCERVVVGTKRVERPVMQEVGKEVVIQEIVEWKCPKVLEPLAPRELQEEIAADV